MVSTVYLNRGFEAKVDDEDLEACTAFLWTVDIRPSGQAYARRHVAIPNLQAWEKGKRRKIYLHRFVLSLHKSLPPGINIDHRDNDGLNCQKDNLRPATYSENGVNFDRNNATGFRGVQLRKDKKARPYRAQISFKGDSIHIGYYATGEEAARAYDRKCIELFGEFAVTNFGDQDA